MLDEDALFENLQERMDALLAPNATSLNKFYKMPAKFEGNLLLIMYYLGNTLEEISERLKYETPKLIPVINTDQCFGKID